MDSWPQRKQTYGPRKSMLRQFAEMLVIVIAVAALCSFLNLWKTSDSSVFSFQTDSFQFTPCDGITCTVEYAQIQSLSLVDTPETFGVCSAGGTQKGLVYGCWKESDEEAFVYVLTGLPKTILLETAQQKLMFNYTDTNSTEALYASLYDVWQETAAGASASVQIGE